MSRPTVNKIFETELIFELGGQMFPLTFILICPRCHWRYLWRKSPGDPHHSQHPPRFICKQCQKQFYPHTSALFPHPEEPNRLALLTDLFTTSKTLATLEQIYGVSQTRLSEFKTWFLERIHHHREALMAAYVDTLPADNQPVLIYLDGMAIRVQNTCFMLMLAVDTSLNILSFGFARKENADTIYPVFRRALELKGEQLGEFQDKNEKTPRLILGTDGGTGYRKMLLEHRVNCIHLTHIHKEGGQKLNIRLIRCTEKEVIETQMGTTIDVVRTTGTNQVRVLTLKQRKNRVKGKRGRPKGSPNRPKPLPTPKTGSSKPKKRGPKNPWRDGTSLFIHVHVDQRQLRCYQPFTYEITLKYVARLFYGQCITSNPVEIVNSQIRRILRMTGPWRLHRAELALLAFMFLKKEIITEIWLQLFDQDPKEKTEYALVPVLA